jgi:N-dimethylarginine dimethylaminohydrolase
LYKASTVRDSGIDTLKCFQKPLYARLRPTSLRVLLADGYPAFAERLQELRYQTIVLEMSEFRKMDGGLSCLSLRF